MMKPVLFFLLILSVGLACTAGKNDSIASSNVLEDKQLYEMASTYLFPVSQRKVQDSALVALGRKLFMDSILSKDGSVSCNTCHDLANYGVDGLRVSKGVGGAEGVRNSPTVFFAGESLAQFWDGRAKTLEEQVKGPLFNPKEMGLSSRQEIARRLRRRAEYIQEFESVFGDGRISWERVARAIAAFERTLVVSSRWDEYLRGNLNALSQEEKRGLKVMLDRGCIPCHSGVAMGGALYQRFGIFDDYRVHTGSEAGDEGRFAVTGKASDKDVFKVPSLRLVVHTAPYFHDGSVATLDEAIRIMGRLQLGIELRDDEVADIIAFLKAVSPPEAAPKG